MSSRILNIRVADGTALSNSTTETPLDSYSFPAHSMGLGKIFRISGKVRATATNSTDTLTVKAYGHTAAAIGGTAVGATGAVDAANDDVVYFDLEFIPQSAAGSSAGTIEVMGVMTTVGAEGTVTARAVHQQLTSVNYGAAYYVVVTGQWSVAHAGNSCVSEALNVIEFS